MDGEKIRRRATVLDENGNPSFVGLPFSIVGVGGPNGDGNSEIVWHNSDTGETQIWFMNGERLSSRATVLDENGNPSFIGLPYSIVGVADFTGDGNPDILWHNRDTNETQIWFMDRGRIRRRATVLGENGILTFVGLPFSIVGARDLTPSPVLGVFPSDQPEIVWHNSDTGETQIWFMNGERVSSRATVLDENGNPSFIGLPYSIVGTNYFGPGVISAGLKYPPIPRVSFMPEYAAREEATNVEQQSESHAPLSIAEAKRRLAVTLGVDPTNIRITVEA